MPTTPGVTPTRWLAAAILAASTSTALAQSPPPDHTWVPAQYGTVSSKDYIPPQFRTVETREWIPAQERTVEVRAWVPPHYEDRVTSVFVPPRQEKRREYLTDYCGRIVGSRSVYVIVPGTGVWIPQVQRVKVPGTGQYVMRKETQLVRGTGMEGTRSQRVQIPGTGVWVERQRTELVPGTGTWVPTASIAGAPPASGAGVPPAPVPGAPPVPANSPPAGGSDTPPADIDVLKATGEAAPRTDLEPALAHSLALRDARRQARSTLRGAAMAIALGDGTRADALAARQADAALAIESALEGAAEVASGIEADKVVATLAIVVAPLRAALEEIRARERAGR